MGQTASSSETEEPKDFRFSCTFGLNPGRFNGVINLDIDPQADNKAKAIPADHKHIYEGAKSVWEAWFFEVGQEVLAESNNIMTTLRVVQQLIGWMWLLGVLFASLGGGLEIDGMLIVGIICLVIWALCSVASFFWLQPAMDRWYDVFRQRVAERIDEKATHWSAALGPHYSVRCTKMTRPGQVFRGDLEQMGPPYVMCSLFLGLTVWVLPALIFMFNFCCLRCEPSKIDHYEIEVSYVLDAPSSMPQQMAMAATVPMMQSQMAAAPMGQSPAGMVPVSALSASGSGVAMGAPMAAASGAPVMDASGGVSQAQFQQQQMAAMMATMNPEQLQQMQQMMTYMQMQAAASGGAAQQQPSGGPMPYYGAAPPGAAAPAGYYAPVEVYVDGGGEGEAAPPAYGTGIGDTAEKPTY